MPIRRLAAWIAPVCATALLAGCGDGAGPPDSAEGAAGKVTSGASAASQDSAATGALSGGPAGQTPTYGEPGGVPTMITEPGDGAPASVGSGTAPSGANAGEQTPPK